MKFFVLLEFPLLFSFLHQGKKEKARS